MYFQRALVVSAAAATHGPAFRTAFFAALNTWSAAAILLMQVGQVTQLWAWLHSMQQQTTKLVHFD
jgi:hypothetical protein